MTSRKLHFWLAVLSGSVAVAAVVLGHPWSAAFSTAAFLTNAGIFIYWE